jgi:muramoyltetrapeptide carboxypeptidase
MKGPGVRLPRRLPEAATIGVCALSGRVDAANLDKACNHLRHRGHRVVVAPHITATWRYFAGTDAERVAGLDALLDDDSIDLVIAARGGYGLSRLMAMIDWARVGASGKAFIGFSDFTAFNMAAYAQGGLATFHGPMLGVDFGHDAQDDFMVENFWPVLTGKAHTVEVQCNHGYGSATIEGVLWGGNLSLLGHLAGTPYFPAIEGGILYVEEIAEEPYAIERLFLQLWHQGSLARQKALLLGDFTDCRPLNTARYPYSMDEVIDTLRSLLPYPVLTGLPFGHIARKMTLPFGTPGSVEIRAGGYAIQMGSG